MRKISLLFVLLYSVMMIHATAYCDAPIKSVQDHDATVTMRLVSGTLYEFSITTADNIQSFNAAGSNFYANVNGAGGYHLSEYLIQNGNTLSVQFESNIKPSIYVNALFIVLEGIGENQFDIPMDADWEICGDAKSDPALTLNAIEKTLDASISETFQIVVEQSGDGAISYHSGNTGIASVSESGLVTAVGRGTTTISVLSTETDTYAAGLKTLAVTVTGPVNWDAIAWLSGGNEKYKVIIEPEIANQFGGQHIENSNLWIGFPSAVFGDNSAVEHTALGAGVSFPLSQFPKEFNDFNFICDGVTYAITLYYADGEKDGGQGEGGGEEGGGEDQALDDVLPTTQASKILRNGQLYIERNGIRYTSTGAQVQ